MFWFLVGVRNVTLKGGPNVEMPCYGYSSMIWHNNNTNNTNKLILIIIMDRIWSRTGVNVE